MCTRKWPYESLNLAAWKFLRVLFSCFISSGDCYLCVVCDRLSQCQCVMRVWWRQWATRLMHCCVWSVTDWVSVSVWWESDGDNEPCCWRTAVCGLWQTESVSVCDESLLETMSHAADALLCRAAAGHTQLSSAMLQSDIKQLVIDDAIARLTGVCSAPDSTVRIARIIKLAALAVIENCTFLQSVNV